MAGATHLFDQIIMSMGSLWLPLVLMIAVLLLLRWLGRRHRRR